MRTRIRKLKVPARSTSSAIRISWGADSSWEKAGCPSAVSDTNSARSVLAALGALFLVTMGYVAPGAGLDAW